MLATGLRSVHARARAFPDQAALELSEGTEYVEDEFTGGRAGIDGFRQATERDVSSDAIYRHSQKHLSRAQLRAAIDRADAAEEQHQVGLVLDARKLRYKAVQLLLAAERSGDLATAIRGIREARDCLLAEARLSGQLDPPSVNVNVENEAPSVVVVLPANGREPPELIGEAVND
jgi:hypothetical protein